MRRNTFVALGALSITLAMGSAGVARGTSDSTPTTTPGMTAGTTGGTTAGTTPAVTDTPIPDGAKNCAAKIGFLGPFTGDAASIGQEQLNWGRMAIDDFNAKHGTKFALVETDTKLDPAEATTGAQKLTSDAEVVAVVGPAGSQEVEAIGPLMTETKLAFVSSSATRTSLTDGKLPTFSRVIPNDDAQGPTVADFAVGTMGATKVLIVDDQTSYSTGLADSVTKALEAKSVPVQRESVSQKQTDFSTIITGMGSDVNVVFLPWQLAANAQQFGVQLAEQGKTAKIIGSDGVYSPSDFTTEGAYVTSFAPDVRGVAAAKDIVAAYVAKHDDKFGTFGPPTYLAAQVTAIAVATTCTDGKPGTREAVGSAVRTVTIASSLLGGPLSLDSKGDPVGAHFYLSTIKDGKYVTVEG